MQMVLSWVLILCCICSYVQSAGNCHDIYHKSHWVTHTAWCRYAVWVEKDAGFSCKVLPTTVLDTWSQAWMSPPLLHVVVSTSTSLPLRYQWCTADTTITTTDSLSRGWGGVCLHCTWKSTALEDISRAWWQNCWSHQYSCRSEWVSFNSRGVSKQLLQLNPDNQCTRWDILHLPH